MKAQSCLSPICQSTLEAPCGLSLSWASLQVRQTLFVLSHWPFKPIQSNLTKNNVAGQQADLRHVPALEICLDTRANLKVKTVSKLLASYTGEMTTMKLKEFRRIETANRGRIKGQHPLEPPVDCFFLKKRNSKDTSKTVSFSPKIVLLRFHPKK